MQDSGIRLSMKELVEDKLRDFWPNRRCDPYQHNWRGRDPNAIHYFVDGGEDTIFVHWRGAEAGRYQDERELEASIEAWDGGSLWKIQATHIMWVVTATQRVSNPYSVVDVRQAVLRNRRQWSSAYGHNGVLYVPESVLKAAIERNRVPLEPL